MAKRRAAIPAFHLVRRRRRQYTPSAQRGGSCPVFSAMQPMQRGYGHGGIFRSLFRTVTPNFKKGLAHGVQRALTAGANALADMSANNQCIVYCVQCIKEALKKQVKSEITTLNPVNRLNVLASEPRKRKAPQNRTHRKRKVARKGKITL